MACRLARGFRGVVREHVTRQAVNLRGDKTDVTATLYEGTLEDVQRADALYSPLRRTQIQEVETMLQVTSACR